MSMTLQAFRRLVYLSKQELGRVVLNQHSERTRLNKEPLAVRNLIKIVDATLALSNAKNFQAMSLRDLSLETGLGMSELHAYIRDKDDLISLIQSYGYMMSARILLDQIKDIHTPLEQLRIAVRTHVFLSETLLDWFYFSYMETRNMAAEEKRQARQAELGIEELFCNIIRAGQRQGVFRELDPQLSVSLLEAMLQDWYLKRWKYRQRQLDVETYVSFVQAMLERHLLSEQESENHENNRLAQ
jgi:AcrR family transcriptional regulator